MMNQAHRIQSKNARNLSSFLGWCTAIAILLVSATSAVAQVTDEATEYVAPSENLSAPRQLSEDMKSEDISDSPKPKKKNTYALPMAEMPVWEYIYKKARDPSADVRMFAPRKKSSPSISLDDPNEDHSTWGKVKRAFGVSGEDKNHPKMVKGADGQLRPVYSERGTDRYKNPGYLAAEELFRKEEYKEAHSAFTKLARKYKGKPIEEDILFMKAECEFKLDKLPKAQDSYHALLVKYPTTRYMPQAIQRSYDIAYYWLEDSRLRAEGKPGKYSAFSRYINFFDRTRPIFDTPGRALDTVEVIQQYDPFGPLTDDAGMMAGGESFLTDRYIQATTYYEQLIMDQPQSEHVNKAKILCEQAYLRAYRGPQYDDTDLDGAYKMAKAALDSRDSFGDEQVRRLEADVRAIHIERAKRDYSMGEDFRRRRLYTSAKYYYQLVVRDYSDTDWARKAEERLRELGDKETKHFKFPTLSNPFTSKKARPLSNPFDRNSAREADGKNPSVSDENKQLLPGGDERSLTNEAEAEEETIEEEKGKPAPEKKSLWGMRNWLEQL